MSIAILRPHAVGLADAADGAPDDWRLALPAAGSLRMAPKDVFKTNEVKTSASFSNQLARRGAQPLRFADLVVLAGWLHPFPFRTRP
jgi:hypothetical protein